MTSGIRGNSPGFIGRVDLWCSPGSGFSYATAGVHMLSMMIREITGMELQAYIQEGIATPLQWGDRGGILAQGSDTHSRRRRDRRTRPDMIRFGELLLNEGRWRGQQIIPMDYARACGRLSITIRTPRTVSSSCEWRRACPRRPARRILEDRFRRALLVCGALTEDCHLETRRSRRAIQRS